MKNPLERGDFSVFSFPVCFFYPNMLYSLCECVAINNLLSQHKCRRIRPQGRVLFWHFYLARTVLARCKLCYILCVSGLTKQQSIAFFPEPHGHISPFPQHCTYFFLLPQGQGESNFSYIVWSAILKMIIFT